MDWYVCRCVKYSSSQNHGSVENGMSPIILPPRKLTWNLKMMVSNRNLLFQGFIFRFHVSFPGCSFLSFWRRDFSTEPTGFGSSVFLRWTSCWRNIQIFDFRRRPKIRWFQPKWYKKSWTLSGWYVYLHLVTVIFMVNLGKYAIHWVLGIWKTNDYPP